MKSMKKFLSFLLAILFVMSVFAGCSNDANVSVETEETPPTEKTQELELETEESVNSGQTTYDELVIGMQTLSGTLDVNASVSNAGIPLYYNIADTLIMRDTNADEVAFVPGLAESWEAIDDYTWEFNLREGVKFHDGSEMTSEDVKYSIERVMNEEDPSYVTANNYLFSNFEEVEIIDDYTIRIHTKNTEPLMEFMVSDPNGGITSKSYVEEVGFDIAAHEPIYTGPYKVISFDPDSELVIERFEDFWGEKAPFQKVIFKLIPEMSSRVTALQNGEVDMIANIPPDQETVFENNENFIVNGELMPMYHIYRFNMSNPAVADSKLRTALDLAIDRDQLVEGIWLGKAEAATSFQFEEVGEPLYILEEEDNITYDLEKAKQLVEESDYDGELIEIYNTADYYTYADLAAQAVTEMWSLIGVNATLVEAESFANIPGEDMELITWSNPLYYPDPMGVIERHWAPEGARAIIGEFIPTDRYTELFATARYDLDKEERAKALQEMQQIVREETPYIYLYKPYEALVYNSDIEYEYPNNVRAHVIGLRAGEISVK